MHVKGKYQNESVTDGIIILTVTDEMKDIVRLGINETNVTHIVGMSCFSLLCLWLLVTVHA